MGSCRSNFSADPAGSLYAIQLGPCSRLAKLQSEHVRLCLNSLALKPGLQENATGEEAILMQNCVRLATESALNTIQTHFDVSRTDMILSYSVDVSMCRGVKCR